MFTIMHISDLHRAVVDPITNAELLSSLSVDREKFPVEARPIAFPDALVVSGDMVQGLRPGTANYPDLLREQYREAGKFLADFTDKFLNSDRSKVILIPGNHDVDWTAAREGMIERDPHDSSIKGNVRSLLSEPRSRYRWDWQRLKLYEIADVEKYSDRFSFYNEFASDFYKATRLRFGFTPRRPWNIFEFDSAKIVIGAFNSCTSNDCFSQVGDISLQAISECHNEIQSRAPLDALRIAVWHHNVGGPPNASDYIDPSRIPLLIDKGFAIGLHGHQHKSEALPFTLYASGKHEMVVFSAGSLCAGSTALPQGYNPQYNLLELDVDRRIATVHVREMIERGIFAPGRLNVFNRASYFETKLRAVPPTKAMRVTPGGGDAVRIGDEIENLRVAGDYPAAIAKLRTNANTLGVYGRALEIDLLQEGSDWEGLVAMLSTPTSIAEALIAVRARIELREYTEAEEALFRAEREFGVDAEIASDLRSRIMARKSLERR